MSNETSSTDKTATIYAIAIFAAMVLGCVLPPSLTRKDPTPTPANIARSSPSPSRSPTSFPSPLATPDKYAETRAKEDAFDAKEKEFLKLPARVQLAAQPYLKGKAAFYFYHVELGEKDVSWVFENNLDGNFSGYDLKIKDVTAQTPEEVETVVLRKCQQVRKGTYRIYSSKTGTTLNTVPAYIWRCELTIVDRTIPAVIHRKRFESELEETGSATGNEEEFDAGIPYEEIYDFLGALSRR